MNAKLKRGSIKVASLMPLETNLSTESLPALNKIDPMKKIISTYLHRS
jgi:hypothetical protein